MTINKSVIGDWDDELSFDTSQVVAGFIPMGTLKHNPVIIIFDNQSNISVEFSNNGTSTKKTFPAGEALLLDMRANHGFASNFTFLKGMPLFARGVSGVGPFKISVIYAVES